MVPYLIIFTCYRVPATAMNGLTLYASGGLKRIGLEDRLRKRWPGMWLWKRKNVRAAIQCVVDERGDPMAVFETFQV